MRACALPPKRGKVGTITVEELARLRAAGEPTRALADRAGVSVKRMRTVLLAIGLPRPRGGPNHRAKRGP